MRALRSFHTIVGVLGLIAFVLTGQFMAIFLKGLTETPDGPRLLYRSAHLYLMWSSLLNLAIGATFQAPSTRGVRIAQTLASALLLAGPPLMLAGFFVESPTGTLDRVFTGWGNYFALAGAVLHVGVRLKSSSGT